MVLYCVGRTCFLKKHALSSKTHYVLASALPPQIYALLLKHFASNTVLKMSHCISTCALTAQSTIRGHHILSTTPSSSNSHFCRYGHSETNSSTCNRMYSAIHSFQLSFQLHETGVHCSLLSAPTQYSCCSFQVSWSVDAALYTLVSMGQNIQMGNEDLLNVTARPSLIIIKSACQLGFMM